MRVEEIALRQEIRQMLNEAGVNRNTLREMAEKLVSEEVARQVGNTLKNINVEAMVRKQAEGYVNGYSFKETVRQAVLSELKDKIDVNINVGCP